jgi:NAD(P)-dependent dehydrogenase (short-subunit alcohol dehydrogenase family)
VDLLGTAFVIGAFFAAIEAGGSLICISSMSGHMGTLSPELERHLALAPVEKLLEHAEIDPDLPDGMAYMIAKRGNILRVQAAASSWGSKGARINSISPGLIISRMGNAELEGPTGDFIRPLTKVSGARRFGTAADIANTALFLSGPDSSFITGNDFLVDGGVTSAFRWNF